MRQNEFDDLCNSERGWAFERVTDARLDGHDHKRVEGVESRGECARLCLLEEGELAQDEVVVAYCDCIAHWNHIFVTDCT